MTDCNLIQLGNSKWWCPDCDPKKRRPLLGNYPRSCRAAEASLRPFELGDRIGQALSLIGITDERVSAWLGRPCGCPERREKLNQLDRWARRKLKGLFKTDKDAAVDLEEILDQ